jgi:hypothetical protein
MMLMPAKSEGRQALPAPKGAREAGSFRKSQHLAYLFDRQGGLRQQIASALSPNLAQQLSKAGRADFEAAVQSPFGDLQLYGYLDCGREASSRSNQ